VQFGPGIVESDLTTSSAVVNGVTITTIVNTNGQTVTIDGGGLFDVGFGDGSAATLSELLSPSYTNGTATYSTVSATAGAGIVTLDLTGGANVTATANTLNDVLTANGGSDTLIAGTGNDTLIGGGTSDTYVIAAGKQTTTIEQSGALDTLSFGTGVTLADLSATAALDAKGNTVITLQNSLGGTVVIDASANSLLDQIDFADGSTGSLCVGSAVVAIKCAANDWAWKIAAK
jgi:Ca2+-binding RTX toxin-like protein